MSKFVSRRQLDEAVDAVRQRCDQTPTVGIVLGSGLGSLADSVEQADVFPSQDIPHWPTSTVRGHSGRLLIGTIAGKTVLMQQGRAHFYEGYSMSQITLPARLMARLGVQTLLVTNAAGGINRDFTPGDLMLMTDHINMPGMAGHNPLIGPNDDAMGPRFPDLTNAYDLALREIALRVAKSNDIELQQGTYVYLAGPSFETPAELRFLHAVGADAVGMSTVPTVIVARHAGMRVLGISSITNKSILDPTADSSVTHEEVLEIGRQIIPRLAALIRGVLAAL
jgi:purine-nucleoside phosphorylase